MFGFGRKSDAGGSGSAGAREGEGVRVARSICTDRFNARGGGYPHVGLLDCREEKVWIAKPLGGQAIRTSHARLITGSDNATSTVWKDRFLCFWFYTPGTAPTEVSGYPINPADAHLIVRTDPNWDYDRQRLVPSELTDHVDENLARQAKHGERIFRWYLEQGLSYPLSLHLVGHRLAESRFYVRRWETNG